MEISAAGRPPGPGPNQPNFFRLPLGYEPRFFPPRITGKGLRWGHGGHIDRLQARLPEAQLSHTTRSANRPAWGRQVDFAPPEGHPACFVGDRGNVPRDRPEE